jgi:hypothetical protein
MRGAAGRALLLAGLVLAAPSPASALDIWRSDDGSRGVELTPSLKLFFFGIAGTLAPPEGFEDLWPIPEVGGGTLGRLRLRLVSDLTSRIRLVVHYEHRPRVLSSGRLLGSVSPALQGDEEIPYRLHPLVWRIAESEAPASPADDLLGAESPTFVWEHEIDRAAMSFSLPLVDVTVGRQAIGWGLGRLWAPLDLFAPMSPTDLDREERRGVDALRLTLSLSQSSYVEVVAVGGAETDEEGRSEVSWDASALAWLARVEAWGVDFLLAAGKLGRDRVIGAGVSGQLFGVTLRGEVTGTEDESGELYGRATAGVEFGTPVNISGSVEYHWSGFGALEPADYLARAERFASRISSGQLAGLGQHYLGVTLAWQPGAWGGVTLAYVQNLTDGSLVLSPAVEYVLSDEVRIGAVALIPIGAAPAWRTEAGLPVLEPRSEFGLGAQMYVVQVRASI